MKFNTMISTGDGEEVLCIQDKKDIYICSRDHLDFSRQVEEVYDGSENEEEIIDKLNLLVGMEAVKDIKFQ